MDLEKIATLQAPAPNASKNNDKPHKLSSIHSPKRINCIDNA